MKENKLELKLGSIVPQPETPKDTYMVEWSARHGDCDHSTDETIQCNENEMWLFLWISNHVDNNRDSSDINKIYKVLEKYDGLFEKMSGGYDNFSDYSYEVFGNDVRYTDCVCGIDYPSIYRYDANGVKYNVLVDGKEFYSGNDSIRKNLDRWFIESYPEVAIDLSFMLSDESILEEYKDLIEGRKMDLI